MGSNEVVDLLLGLCLAAIVIVPGSIVLRLVRRARANERCFATLVEHLPSTGVTVLDESLRVEFAGGAALTDAGWPAQDVVGRSLHEVLPRDEADFLARQFRAGLAGESRSVEHHATRSGQDFAL